MATVFVYDQFEVQDLRFSRNCYFKLTPKLAQVILYYLLLSKMGFFRVVEGPKKSFRRTLDQRENKFWAFQIPLPARQWYVGTSRSCIYR